MRNIFDLTKMTAIVTGGGSGLGKQMSKALARAGADIVIADISINHAKETSNDILELGRKSLSIKTDVTNKQDLRNMVEKTLNEFNKIDILVNSAGIMIKGISLVEMEEQIWRKVIDVNLNGTFLSNQAVAKQMIKQKSGRIINIASMSGSIINRNSEGIGAYCASKSGVIQLTKALAIELVQYNITVNSISPGYMRTPLVSIGWEKNPIDYKERMGQVPMGRPGKPEELDGLVVYLASNCSSYMTGSNIIIDGGYTSW